MTPAVQAAASSPRECPMTAEGTTPAARRAAAVPHSTANSAGWAYRVVANSFAGKTYYIREPGEMDGWVEF